MTGVAADRMMAAVPEDDGTCTLDFTTMSVSGMDAIFLVLSLFLSDAPAVWTTENFVVHAASAAEARRLAESCEASRSELALRWLGGPLPTWPTRAVVHHRPGVAAVRGTAWPANPAKGYDDHRLWLAGPLEELCAEVAPHEVCHLVLADAGLAVPAWCDEGIACQCHGSAWRRRSRSRALETLRLEDGPNVLARALDPADFGAHDADRYALAEALTAYLLARTGRPPADLLPILARVRRPDDLRELTGQPSVAALVADWNDWLIADR